VVIACVAAQITIPVFTKGGGGYYCIKVSKGEVEIGRGKRKESDYVIMLLCYYVIMLLCCYVVMLLCCYVIMLLCCYYVISFLFLYLIFFEGKNMESFEREIAQIQVMLS
jgi:hypothetical protein